MTQPAETPPDPINASEEDHDSNLASDAEQLDQQPTRTKRTRRSGTERRAQIARATYELVAECGINGTSVQLIAERIGVTPQALYAHFDSRHEMLIAALDCLYERLLSWHTRSTNPNIRERLREIMYAHAEFMASDLGFLFPAFQFAVAPRDTDLAACYGNLQLRLLEEIAALIAEGQRQGSIRKDLDPMSAAWQLNAFAWSEDMAMLMGRTEYINKGYSRELVDLVIGNMTPRDKDRESASRAT